MDCWLFVAPDGFMPVVGRPAPVQAPLLPVRLVPLDIETMTQRRYVRLLAAFMQVRHATQPFATVQA